jgi:hypothetical protein
MPPLLDTARECRASRSPAPSQSPRLTLAFTLAAVLTPALIPLFLSIGPEAERLAWIFCMVDRASVDETVLRPHGEASDLAGWSFRSRLELGAFAMPLKDEEEWLDFITLSLADWLEQVAVGRGEVARGGQGWV